MGEMSQEGAQLSIGTDLSQFFQVFFEEAGENLDTMEQMLLHLDLQTADDEELNAVFRCAHSVKGGAATFGFTDVAELTHEMETLLDKLRRHELAPTPDMVDVLLAAGDVLKAQLARHNGHAGEAPDTTALRASIRALVDGGGAPARATPELATATPEQNPADAAAAATAAPATIAATGERLLELTVGPLDDPALADNLIELFREIGGLGTIDALDAGRAADGMRRFKVVTTSSDNDLLDLFSFHVAREQVRLAPLGPGYGFHAGAPGAPPDAAEATDAADDAADAPSKDPGWGFFDDAPGAPEHPAAAPSAHAPGDAASHAAHHAAATAPAAPAARPAGAATGGARTDAPRPAGSPESSTLRVSVEKVDQLINLVGELVITQAMLAENSKGIDAALHQQLSAGLADLERNTRDLQEAVMSIRMIPMSLVFNRFPRMLRDLAAKLGKKVELVTQGEATELDKGLVEKITDPLTHLVRNSCDHGIEQPEERLARGKPAHGTVTLVASHQGGSIVIEVRDDGRGLNRDKLLAKARERGIDAPDGLSDQEVYGLIFAPGFSTAEAVTDVSGRGVGMDVVKKNIGALGGTVEIDSAEGYGMSVRVRLPLTLAIMDGMSVGVGEECYILPLGSVVESFQVRPDTIRTIGGRGRVVQVRDEYMPVVDLEKVFDVPRFDFEHASHIMVVVEAEGGRIALLVDELLGQQQVVVKNLEANYRKVDDVSGATILGDGRVALILDIGSLVRRSRS
jgi:two-component system, chemotaxis family, sensor kinase CheA